MFRIPRVSISMRELDRLKCIQGLIDKQFKQKAVAERLGLTVRQVRRLVERYELEGPRGLISKLRDRPGNRRLKPERAEEVLPSSVPNTPILDQLWRLRSSESAMASTWRSRPSDL
jgi:transposase